MRKIFLLFFPFALFANPLWFYNLKPSDKNEIIGYGMASTLSNAKQNAITDIVKTISVEVDTSTDISKSVKNGKYNKNISSNLSTKSKASLSGIKVLNVEEIKGNWYVASSYDNSPIDIKLKKLLPENIKEEKQNNYLRDTELFQIFNSKIGKKLDYKIIRKDNLWQLRYKDITLPLNQSDFYKLFSNQSNKTITLKANKKVYKENDEMYFKIDLSKKGYVSILYVEHNGKVGVLSANKLKNRKFTYPDLKSEDTFKIANPYGQTIKELYVAIYSKEPIDLDQFENVSDDLLDESNFNFHKLLEKLSKYKPSTFTIKIKK